jgi:hypothetical protein
MEIIILVSTDVSDKPAASVIRLGAWKPLFIYPDDGGNRLLWNVVARLHNIAVTVREVHISLNEYIALYSFSCKHILYSEMGFHFVRPADNEVQI